MQTKKSFRKFNTKIVHERINNWGGGGRGGRGPGERREKKENQKRRKEKQQKKREKKKKSTIKEKYRFECDGQLIKLLTYFGNLRHQKIGSSERSG
jgi:hypothetical protein